MRSFHTTLPMSGSCEKDIAEVSVPGVETQPVGAASRRAVRVATSGAASPPRLRTVCAGSLIHHLCDHARGTLLCSPLLVIPDGAAQVSDPGYEGYLRCELLFRTWLWVHVADIGYLTLGLLRRLIELHTKRLAGGVLQVHRFRADYLGLIDIGNDRAVTDIETVWI